MRKEYPLAAETNNGVLVRLMEECAELIAIASKCNRFGPLNHHPDRTATNYDELLSEFNDVMDCVTEFRSRIEGGGTLGMEAVTEQDVRDLGEHARAVEERDQKKRKWRR